MESACVFNVNKNKRDNEPYEIEYYVNIKMYTWGIDVLAY